MWHAGHIECQVVGWDISRTAVDYANHAWAASQAQSATSERPSVNVHFEQADVFYPKELKFDIVYCCLFLHHFAELQAVEVLQAMKGVATFSVLVDDLKRSRLGYALAQIGCQLLSRSPVVHFDGPQSVRAAFTTTEVRQLATQAGLEPCRIRSHWPERYLLRWDA
jgi:2-polyprenyl-3-methyl-5-hydroxy-6-metoxy-1,4-benzoquinol methylase